MIWDGSNDVTNKFTIVCEDINIGNSPNDVL